MKQTMKIRSFARASSRPFASHSTEPTLKKRPELSDEAFWRENGISHDLSNPKESLYSVAGYRLAWERCQDQLLGRINALTTETIDEHKTLEDIVETYSAYPEKAQLFNNASMAMNNHFFFRGITTAKTEPSAELKALIENSFSSLESFGLEFIEHASAMFGPGFVWLVQDRGTDNLRILVTYIAGSPYRSAHAFRGSPVDAATEIKPPQGRTYRDRAEQERMTRPQNSPGKHGKEIKTEYNSEPILCVNTWQSAYLRDFNLDKKSYVRRWWKFIDWKRASEISRDITNSRLYSDSASNRKATESGRRLGNVNDDGRLQSVIEDDLLYDIKAQISEARPLPGFPG
ncbi:MAG: hypothetical protein Q9227_000681 [Pyrenula ochraceoflavens]